MGKRQKTATESGGKREKDNGGGFWFSVSSTVVRRVTEEKVGHRGNPQPRGGGE